MNRRKGVAPAATTRRWPSPIRALTYFETLPPHHKTFYVGDDNSAPHLKPGEFAVIDETDRNVQHGELYLIQWNSGNRSIVQVTSRHMRLKASAAPELTWWVCELRGFRQVASGGAGGVPLFSGMSDGPYNTAHLKTKTVGRIVGFAQSPLGPSAA
jgi:hypothetical protein